MGVFDSDGNGMVMPVSPMYGNGGSFGMNGDWWLILLIAFALFGGGFGGMGWGGFNGGMMDGAMIGGAMYPWFNQAQLTTNGFQNQATNSAIAGLQNSVTSGFGDVQLGIAGLNQNICQTGSGITAAVTNGFAQAEIANNARQIADMQQNFAAQTATMQGFNGLQSQLAQCCCDNRAATADLRYTVATEACADRSAISSALRDVLEANNASTQRILDQLCADRLSAKDEKISELQQQLNFANLMASQNAQTAAIQSGQRALANEVEQYVNPTPRPSYVVANPYCCNNACGC